MVFTWNDEPSKDLSYSSLEIDETVSHQQTVNMGNINAQELVTTGHVLVTCCGYMLGMSTFSCPRYH